MPAPQPFSIEPRYAPISGDGGYGEYFTEAPAPLMPIDMAPTAGLGATNVTQQWIEASRKPRARASGIRFAANISPFMGALGQAADAVTDRTEAERRGDQAAATRAAVLLGVIALGLLIRGGAGYIAGRAMAPSAEAESRYAWGGVAASVFLGALGLGIVGAVSLSKR